MSVKTPPNTTQPPAGGKLTKLEAVGVAFGIIGALATTVACLVAYNQFNDLRQQAAESQVLAKKSYDLASEVQKAQVRADERKYAEMVHLRTDHIDSSDSKGNETVVKVRVTIKNFSPTASITDLRLETPGDGSRPASIVRLNSIGECRTATFSIAGNWWQRSRSFVVFRDPDGRYWKRVESEPVARAQAAEDQVVYRRALSGNSRSTKSSGFERLKPDKGESNPLSSC